MTTQLAKIRSDLPLMTPTSPKWVETVMNHLDKFLVDHASCERKAYSAAMMIVSKFPEYPELQDLMIGLAREELEHFHQIFRILKNRNIAVGLDEVDVYVKKLLTHVRDPRPEHLLDRLLVVAIVEARSCERFCLFAEAIQDPYLKDFYVGFAIAESAHFPLFVNAAKMNYAPEKVDARLHELLKIEAQILSELPIQPTVH